VLKNLIFAAPGCDVTVPRFLNSSPMQRGLPVDMTERRERLVGLLLSEESIKAKTPLPPNGSFDLTLVAVVFNRRIWYTGGFLPRNCRYGLHSTVISV